MTDETDGPKRTALDRLFSLLTVGDSLPDLNLPLVTVKAVESLTDGLSKEQVEALVRVFEEHDLVLETYPWEITDVNTENGVMRVHLESQYRVRTRQPSDGSAK